MVKERFKKLRFKGETEKFFDKYNIVKRTFSQISEIDLFLMKHYHLNGSEFLLDSISNNLNINNNTKILDIGCGSGGYLIFLSQNLPQAKYYGVDISQAAIDIARQEITKNSFDFFADPYLKDFRYNVNPVNFEFHKNNGVDLPFPGGFFDVVYFINILHHTYGYKEILHEAFRVLKNNGLLIILDLRGHSKFKRNFIKTTFKLIPQFMINKIFLNDLICEDGTIPLRSDVSYKKIKNILTQLNATVIRTATNYSLLNFFVILLKIIDNKFFHQFLLLLLRLIVPLDRKLAELFKNRAGLFAFVVKKNV